LNQIIREEPVYIVNGYITIVVNGTQIKQRVKQTKGLGVADADHLKKLNPFHKEMLHVLLSHPKKTNESIEIRYLIEQDLKRQGKIFRDANWIRPVSELFRKGILENDGKNGNSILYRLNELKAREALTTGLFDVPDKHIFDVGMDAVRRHKLEGYFN